MSILSLESTERIGDSLLVEAVIKDARLVYPQTHLDPAEYGPALCRGSLMLPDDLDGPLNEDQIIDLLESSCVDWTLVDTSDDYDY